MGYAVAGFTIFITILGRYNLDWKNQGMCSCCSVLEQDSSKGFVPNLSSTFRNLVIGLGRLPSLYKQPNLSSILKTSLLILLTAESVCILTAETVDLIFYKYFLFLLDDGDATESVYIFTVSLLMTITITDAGDSMELA